MLPQDPAPTLAGVAADPASLAGGSFLNLTTTLSALPQNNGTVALSSSNPAVVPVPATAAFGWGAQGTQSLVQTQPVTTATAVTITASLNGTSASTVVNVLPGLTLSPATVPGGTASQGTVILTSPLCCNDVQVSLFSSNPAVASAPASVTIPKGSTSATFPVTTSAVTASTNVTITANYSLPTLPSQTATLTVLPGG